MARSVLRVLGAPRPAPALGILRRSKRTIAAGRALRVSFTVSRATTVTVGLQRSRGRGRYASVRRVRSIAANAGENAVTLPGRQIGRRPGLYRVTATLADGGSQLTHFRIRRAR